MNSKLTGEGDDDDVKKNIAIFGNKQRILSIEMKTKVVQHVPRINFGSQLLSDFQAFLTYNFISITGDTAFPGSKPAHPPVFCLSVEACRFQ